MPGTVDIIYCFRNRDAMRVKHSLDSLSIQAEKNFNVIFVDYGSEEKISEEIKTICSNYHFCNYVYIDAHGKMWNRSEALNYGISFSKADYIFTADIDMLFKQGFVAALHLKKNKNIARFFSVGYLSQSSTKKINLNTIENLNYTKSQDFALGMVLVSKEILLKINGYNIFYSLWGQEDNDLKLRLEKAGFQTEFVQEVWMLHQYHGLTQLDASQTPDGWIQFMKDYYSTFQENVEAFKGLSSIVYPFERPAKLIAEGPEIKFKHLSCRKLFLRHVLITDISNANGVKSLGYFVKLSEVPISSNLMKVSLRVKKMLKLLKIPLQLVPNFKDQYLGLNEARDEIYFVLKSLDAFILDYHMFVSANGIRLVICTK